MAFISATLQQAFGRAYCYDMLGRFDDPNFGISQNCPTFVDSLNYSYDNVGNRTDLGATYYAGNRLALFSGGWYTYDADADGNVHQKYGVNPNPHNQIFYWNPENRLDSLSYDGYYNVTYKYNALGKPVLKYRQGTLDGVWLWEGDTWLAEFTPSNYRDSEYLYNGTDEPYASVEGSTTPSSIHYHAQDELGNVLGTYAGTTVTETISYDPWGVPTYTGDLSSRVMWKGLMWEGGPATGDVVGLYYVRGRWYDPQAGRFVQEDPMGVDGGINVYTFAGDDPINGSDPSGMDPDDPYSMGGVTIFGESGYDWPFSFETLLQELGAGGSGGDCCNGNGNDGARGGSGVGGGGGNSKTKTETPPKPSNPKECTLSLGVTGAVGAPVLLGASFFLSGSGSIGITSSGAFFLQASGAMEGGIGAFIGVGTAGGVSRGTPLITGSSTAGQIEANAGLGESLGGTASTDGNGSYSLGFPVKGGPGIGIGAQLAGGPVTTRTHVFPKIPLLGKILRHLCP